MASCCGTEAGFHTLCDGKCQGAALLLQKQECSAEIMQAMVALKDGGVAQKWGAALQEPLQRRNVFMGELKRVGVLNPQAIGIASISEAPGH